MAERCIGYVTSTARTLLLNYHVPWSYWGKAILTSTHLVNRLPSQTLAFTSPIDRLHAAFPVYLSGLVSFPASSVVQHTYMTRPALRRSLMHVHFGVCLSAILHSKKGINAITRPLDGSSFRPMSPLPSMSPFLEFLLLRRASRLMRFLWPLPWRCSRLWVSLSHRPPRRH